MTPEPFLLARRRLTDSVMIILAWSAAMAALLILAIILVELLRRGGSAISLGVFTQTTPAPGGQGGLLNPILGSLSMTAVAILCATPIGVLAGTYLAEFGQRSPYANGVRFLNDTLLSAPSIIIGLFVYGIAVKPVGHFSGWAGALSLALIALPVVVRTTEDMLTMIPDSLREAGIALGMPRWRMIVSIGYRAAATGILTGILLSVARVSGETAPLLFTALNNQFMSPSLSGPTASLPVAIFQFAMSPYKNWQELAWAGALLISTTVLLLNIVARLTAHRKNR
jgi:phosphate transport system permease protein